LINQNYLIILVGLPSSGKSLFALKLKVLIEKRHSHFKVKIVDPDKIRNAITPIRFDYKKERIVRKKNLKEIKLGLKKDFIVISDDLNYFSSMRHDLKKIADNLNKKYFLIHIATPIEQCIKWNNERGNPIPNQVIYNINEKFDSFGGYTWDIPIKVYDLSQKLNMESVLEDLIKYIERSLTYIQVNLGTLNKENGATIKYHQNLDRETRKVVGKLLNNSNYTNIKKEILRERKLFINLNLNKFLKKSEISKKFIAYLEKQLKIDIS